MIDSFTGKYKFLSNFYMIDGWSVEHYYQANKATSDEGYNFVMAASTASEAKKRGRSLEIRSDWEKIKVGIMLECLITKFKYKELEKKLLDTGNEVLVEGNYWHDNFWGNCTCNKCKNIKGLNKLGKLLMFIRWVKQ